MAEGDNSGKRVEPRGCIGTRSRTRIRALGASLAAFALCAALIMTFAVPGASSQPVAPNAKGGKAEGAAGQELTASDSNAATFAVSADSQAVAGDDASAYEPGFMLVTLADGARVDQVTQALSAVPGLSGIAAADVIDNLVRFELPAGVTVEKAVELAGAVDSVEAAQPNYRYYLAADEADAAQAASRALVQSAANYNASLAGARLGSALSAQSTPSDAFYKNQWHLDSINASDAWDSLESMETGPTMTTVAVVDSGFRVDHEDLAANVVATYDATTKQASISPDNRRSSQVDHGTHCAGIIGAVTNNGVGVAGVTDNACRVLPVRVEDKNGLLYTSYIAQAYDYLVSKKDAYNIRVANISLGAPSKTIANRATDVVLYDCMKKGSDAGIVNVVAACNDDEPVPYYAYPSDFDGVVSVVALYQTSANADGVARASYSNYNKGGQLAKTVSAPGSDIVSLLATRNAGGGEYGGTLYGSQDGTSMATPVTSGVLGLMFAASPGLTQGEAMSKLYSSARDLTKSKGTKAGWDAATGFGEVDAKAAVSPDQPYLSGSLKVPAGKAKTLSVKIAGKKQSPSGWQWQSSNTSVATVDASGKVTGVAGGRVIISATNGTQTALQVLTVQVPAKQLQVKLSKTKLAYTGNARKPAVTVTYGGATLKKGHDYTVSYRNNVNAGKGVVTITGIAPYYTGTAKKTFSIVKRSITKASIKLSAKVLPYNGKARKPVVTVYDIGENKSVKLKQGVHYTVRGKGVVSGRGTLTITAKKACANFKGSVVKTFRVK